MAKICNPIRSIADFDALESAIWELIDECAFQFSNWRAQMGDGAENCTFLAPTYDWVDARKWFIRSLEARGEYKSLCLDRAEDALRTCPNGCAMGDIVLWQVAFIPD